MPKERRADAEDRDDPPAFSRLMSMHRVASAPFAGRIGGNQEFIATGDDEATEEILKRQPDAVRSVRVTLSHARRANIECRHRC